MAPLIVLLVVFVLTFLVNRYMLKQRFDLSFVGRFALAVMLLFTGVSHFTHTDLMVQMMPEGLAFKQLLIYLTGVFEICAAGGLIVPKYSKFTSILLCLFFIAILPANVIGSMRQVALGGMERGTDYLYVRIPLQFLFISWAYYFGVTKNKHASFIKIS